MKKASRILLLIGGILAIVAAVAYLIFSIIFFAGGSPEARAAILEGINNGTIQTNGIQGTPEQIADVIAATSTTLGVVFLIMTLLCIPAVIFSFITRKNPTKVKYILCIVFGAVSGVIIPILGGIFGLIGDRQN